MSKLRPSQAEIMRYRGGKMGISAVPGSGKTFTLTMLASQLVTSGEIEDDQELLIVTLANAAVDNFSTRIGKEVQKYGLLPNIGYRVRTLHGLAHDIVRERPDLAGLSDSFQIMDERDSKSIIENAVSAWMKSHLDTILAWCPDGAGEATFRQYEKEWLKSLISVATAFIGTAKDLQIGPDELRARMERLFYSDPLLEFGIEIYSHYRRALIYSSAVDFDDLIQMALQVLKTDPDYLQRLRYRWPFILEDEAQDSSLLQEEVLRLLCGEDGNWVRVGDPNQSIYKTFTTASPEFLRRFLKESDVLPRDLPQSGRFARSIRELANYLIEWNESSHPVPALRHSLDRPLIDPPPPDDDQYMDSMQPGMVHLSTKKQTGDEEIRTVVRNVKKWLENNQDKTVAILTSTNNRGEQFIEALKKANISCIELLKSDQTTRYTANLLANVIQMLSDPNRQVTVAAVYKQIARQERPDGDKADETAEHLISRCGKLEEYFSARAGADWLAGLSVEPLVLARLTRFRERVQRWQAASLLPIDQLVLTISQDLFSRDEEELKRPAALDLALGHKLALVLEHSAQLHPTWQLKDFAEELRSIVKNKTRLAGFQEEDLGFDAKAHPGQVVVATLHKAKGLEWDRVYLTSANNYDYPSAQEYDTYMSEKHFVRGKLNLEAEVLARLTALANDDISGVFLEDGEATRAARLEYCAERLRLFYVGITRACKELVITWNTGSRENCSPSLPFAALYAYWKEKQE